MRILLVEDKRDMNRVSAKRIDRAGYSVDACFDGWDALDYLASTRYDAVVLEVIMPELSVRHSDTRGGVPIELTAKEYVLLEYMLRNKGQVLSREQIEMNIWSFDSTIGSNVVDVYIRMLRRKIDDGYEPKLIHTIRGFGYALKEQA